MSDTQHAVLRGRFHSPWNRPRRTGRQLWRPSCWLALACLLGSGCYSTARVDVSPAFAETTPDLRVDVSDQGRVALADRLGPGVLRIEGELVGATNDSMTIAVSRVSYLDGNSSRWSAEHFQFPREYAAAVYERRLAKGRTISVSSAIIGSAIAFIVTRTLTGRGSTDPGKVPPGGPSGEQ